MISLVKKLAPLCVAAALVAATVTPSFAARSHTGNKFNLLVYTHLQPSEAQVIQGLANTWADNNGGTVKIVVDTGTFQDFATLSHAGKGPDVMFGLPDDNIGTFILGGTVAPVPAGTFNPSAYVPGALPAVTFKGQQYAVPLMLDTYALVYNKKLVHTPPKTFDQLISMASRFPNSKGKPYGFLYDITNFYYSYAFFRGFGSYVFKQNGANVDTSNIGLGNAGGVKTLAFFQDLVRGKKLIPADINYTTAQSLFQKGQLGMFIDGDWDIGANQQVLGKNFGAVALPTLPGGGTPHPFAGVQVAFVNQFSPNKALGFSLIKYLAATFSIPDFKAAGRLPALKADLDNPLISKNPVLAAYATAARNGDPLPNVPEMQSVWTPGANAITLVITGKSTPQAAAANMVTAIKRGIAQLTQ